MPLHSIDRRLRQLQLRTRYPVEHLLAGEYRSVFKGRGMDFDEICPYHPGDEVRSIDWNVTARTGRPYIKRYVEERELAVLARRRCLGFLPDFRTGTNEVGHDPRTGRTARTFGSA